MTIKAQIDAKESEGEKEGKFDGISLGFRDGKLVGVVGDRLIREGVGNMVGAVVGFRVNTDGMGARVGRNVGKPASRRVGKNVGESLEIVI